MEAKFIKTLSSGRAVFEIPHKAGGQSILNFNVSRPIEEDQNGRFIWYGVDCADNLIFAVKRYLNTFSGVLLFSDYNQKKPFIIEKVDIRKEGEKVVFIARDMWKTESLPYKAEKTGGTGNETFYTAKTREGRVFFTLPK